MKRIIPVLLFVIAVLLAINLFRRHTPQPEAERNRVFARSMQGVTLVGRSTRLNSEQVFGPEYYFIDSVTHVSGDAWLFHTRLRTGEKEIPVPIPLLLKWAGDTPVITLTDLAIPGVGKYTARVILYRNHYSGTWSGEKGGGQLFGKIVRGATRQ
jgi:hypothetical protein